MAYPTEPTETIVTIATDANHSDPGEAWDGTPTKVSPSVGLQATGYMPATPRAPEYDNYLFHMLAKWATYAKEGLADLKTRISSDEWIYPTPKTRTIRIPACAGAPLPNYMPLFMSYVTMDTGTSWLAFDLGAHVPSGATITAVRARVMPGSARSGANCMLVDLTTITSDSTTTSEGTNYDDGTATVQTISLTGLSAVVDRSTKRHIARIRSGNDANTYNDLAYYLEVTFTDPGPRNG